MEKTMTGDISVIKRSGKSEPLDINKLHVMVEAACEGHASFHILPCGEQTTSGEQRQTDSLGGPDQLDLMLNLPEFSESVLS